MKPPYIIAAVLLAACGTNEGEWNLSGLEPWQRPIFLQAGRDAGGDPRQVEGVGNNAYLGEVPPEYSAFTWYEGDGLTGDDSYLILFSTAVAWADCAAGASGVDFYSVDFYYVARHEWESHVIGWGHSDAGYRKPRAPFCTQSD